MGDHVECRNILWYMVFFGFAINYMVRISTNITIVEMVNHNSHKKSVNYSAVKSECISDIVVNKTSRNLALASITRGSSLETLILDEFEVDYDKNGFRWNEHETGLILGAYFWLHWVTQLPGGFLATKYGTKKVFGIANLLGCLLCSFMPIASYFGYQWLIFLRVLQGLICGFAWPAMHNLTAKWIPKNERSKFVTAYLGSSVGAALNFPIFGFIMQKFGWEYVYHFCCIVGVIWYLFWYFMVFDSPNLHPRIHPKEREYIIAAIGSSIDLRKDSTANRNIPWKQILTSRPIWINAIAQWGGVWGLLTMLTQAPTFFRYVHGWGVEMTGLLSGIPHLCRFIFALIFSIFGDYLLQSNYLSRTNVRKLGTVFCCIINGLFVICLAYSGCESILAVVFMTLATTVHGAVSTGPLSSIVDLSPNYAGIILGIIGMITIMPGFLSPILVSYLTYPNQTVEQWKIVFLITGSMLIVSGILFVIFADSEQQKWNKYEVALDETDDENEALNDGNNNPKACIKE